MDDTTVTTTEPQLPASVADREELGIEARKQTPLAELGDYAPAPDRPNPVDLLQSQAASRVPELVPVRYGRMLVSPFTFYRGAALIMASDLSTRPRTGLGAQLCGDAHLSNFGGFATPERRLVFDINDFDETNPGPFEWDVMRLVASMEIAGRDREFKKKERADIVRRTAASYRTAMALLAQQGRLDVWYASLDVDKTIGAIAPEMKRKEAKSTSAQLAKARTRTSLQAAKKLTEVVDGTRRFINNPPIIERSVTLAERDGFDLMSVLDHLENAWQEYVESLQADRQHLLAGYTYVDLARKVVGVGSVGTRAWALLMQGRDEDDLLLLQIKEAQPSVLEAFTHPSIYPEHGQRVVQGQRLLQSASDIFLGWARFGSPDSEHTDYYVRQLRDWKVSADITAMTPEALAVYGAACGAVLAKGHARSGERIAISSYLGDDDAFEEAMMRFAVAYADQNEADYRMFSQAVADGQIVAQTGV